MFKRMPVVAGLILIVVLTGASAALGKPTPATTLDKRVTALESAMTALKGQVTTLRGQVAALRRTVSGQAGEIAALKANPVLTLSWLPTYLSLNPAAMNGVSGPNIVFQGANVHVRSTTGESDASGLGNLIVGWNSDPHTPAVGYRSGSNNLVCGDQNSFESYGGFVAGGRNSASARCASVSGGQSNTASGPLASVTGGMDNTAHGYGDSVSGGGNNLADSQALFTPASVVGGWSNKATGPYSCVSGGMRNTAYGTNNEQYGNSVSGGYQNVARGDKSSVSGGQGNVAWGYLSSVSGGLDNAARGIYSSVSGGGWNTAGTDYTPGEGQSVSVSGGLHNTATGDGSSVSGGYQLLLDTQHGWAAGVPGDPAVAPYSQAWFLSPLITTP